LLLYFTIILIIGKNKLDAILNYLFGLIIMFCNKYYIITLFILILNKKGCKFVYMKKLIFLLLVTIITLPSFTQVKGLDFSKAQIINTIDEMAVETLLKNEKLLNVTIIMPEYKKIYMILYENTPVGLKHCIDKTKELVQLNGFNFKVPNLINNELYASYVKGITDYGHLCTSIYVGSSEIKKSWKLSNGYVIGLVLEKDNFEIIIVLQK